jgi:Protein of unknown function (DUF1653)
MEPAKGIYQHFKGGFYEVLGIAEESASGKQFVVYRALGLIENLLPPDPANHFDPGFRVKGTPNHGELAVCSLEYFTELVDGKEFHTEKRVRRFQPIISAGRD